MENINSEEKLDIETLEAHKVLSKAFWMGALTVKDDQHDFPTLLDLVKTRRKINRRFSLVDSGKNESFQLEWLGQAGADIYTTNETRSNIEELELINKACRRGNAITAYLFQGPFGEEDEKDSSFSDLINLGLNGIFVYISDHKAEYEFSQLYELASACRNGGSGLIYYHQGPVESYLGELSGYGVWIHLSDVKMEKAEDMELLIDVIKNPHSRGKCFILHVEKKWEILQLKDILDAGAFILFKSPPSDYKSSLRPVEDRARKKKLDFRAYYLYPEFLR